MNIAFSSSRLSRFFGVGAIALGSAYVFVACGGSTADSDGSSDDGGIHLPADSGAHGDAATPSDAGVPQDGSTSDAHVDTDAGYFTANYATDFSTSTNPVGAWTYGYSIGAPGGDASALIVYPNVTTSSDVTCWYDENDVSLGAPAACINGSATTTSTGVLPGEAALHPGEHGEYSIARWTAPVAGSYVVHTQFKTGDTGETDGMLVHNDTVLWSVATTSDNPVDDRTVTLAAGDTIAVAVGYGDGSFLYDTTPVIFTIHTAP